MSVSSKRANGPYAALRLPYHPARVRPERAPRGSPKDAVPSSSRCPPASTAHLIFRNDYFAAPVRNDADTVWMKERQIETMYRSASRNGVTPPRS